MSRDQNAQLTTVESITVPLGRLSIRLIDELWKASGGHERREVLDRSEAVGHLLHGQGEVVVGVERAARSFAPAVLALQALSWRSFGGSA